MRKNYADRMMRARDPRFAKIAAKMGYQRRDMRAAPPEDVMPALRSEYERVIGKRPFMGWDEATLRDKIAAANKGAE